MVVVMWKHKHKDGVIHEHGELHTTGAHWHPPTEKIEWPIGFCFRIHPDQLSNTTVKRIMNIMHVTFEDFQIEMVYDGAQAE